MAVLKVLAFALLIAGFATVFGSKWAVSRFNLDKDMKCDFENEMSEEELNQYKCKKAEVNVKMYGMLIALPGLVLLLIAFR